MSDTGTCMIEHCEYDALENGIYCTRHLTASNNLEMNYKQWKKAYGPRFTKAKYYDKLMNNKNTGTWVKEIIEQQSGGED